MHDREKFRLVTAQKNKIKKIRETQRPFFQLSSGYWFNVPLELLYSIHYTSNVPVDRPSYRSSQKDNVEIEKQINRLLQRRLIRPSLSPYASSIAMADKKGEGRTRLCIDYRKLNFLTVADYQPIPRVDIFDRLASSPYLSVLDITFG